MNETTVGRDGERTHVLVFENGEEVASGLRAWSRRRGITAGRLSAIGGFSDATLGFFDWSSKSYLDIPVNEQVEVVSMIGDVTVSDGEPHVHAHVVVADRRANARGGHLMEGHVRPTLEVVVVESPSTLPRRHDDRTGLSLIDTDAAVAGDSA